MENTMLTKQTILEILDKPGLQAGINDYCYLLNNLYSTNVAEDAHYQDVFRKFYQMRKFYSDEFASGYFQLLEELKADQNNVTFQEIFDRILGIQNTFEMSFSSKMLHMLQPENPIWDSVVTKEHFGLCIPASGHKNRESACVQRYDLYKKRFYEYLHSDEGQMILTLFNQKFPDLEISDAKKIDFVLWQDRNKKAENHPSDCTIPIDNGFVNIRVGAIIRKGNQFLMVGNDQQDYLYSVGGRVKFGETAEQAVIREVFEETGTEMEVDHLGFIQENFFYGDTGIKKDKLIYEISYYFYMKVPEDFQPKCESFTDDNSRENLVWVTTDCKQMLYPEFFRTELEDPKPYVIHIVTDERQAGEGKKDHGTV